MKHPLETIDCQLSHILGHVIHGSYSLEFLRAIRTEFISCYWALDDEIKKREPISSQVAMKSPPRGLLDMIAPDRGGAA